MNVLWVDDAKPLPDDTWSVARTYDDAWRMLQDYEWDVVHLDHDLGDTQVPERTGYTLLCAMEAGLLRRPKHITIISWNPEGARRMTQVLRRMNGITW